MSWDLCPENFAYSAKVKRTLPIWQNYLIREYWGEFPACFVLAKILFLALQPA
jgi:hypothetical protein